jgi:NADPH:quinone reductase-like Zn-dependent oxidoreductase
MKAVRVHAFGGVDALVVEDVPRPEPGAGEVLVRVAAAGVGPWDALIRSGTGTIAQPLPLTLGSDLAGVVEAVSDGVTHVRAGDAIYGVTNARFTGAYAEFAVASAAMIAPKPTRLGFVEAASVPVVATTAWQMVVEHGRVGRGTRVLIHGAAGNVGAYAVQLAARFGAEIVATAHADDLETVRALGAGRVIDARASRFEDTVADVDVVIDTVGGETQARSFAVLAPGAILVSSAAPPDQALAAARGVRALFFLVEVTTEGLTRLAGLLDAGHLRPVVGDVLPLAEARRAHEMLAGAPHKRGKIVLGVADPTAAHA